MKKNFTYTRILGIVTIMAGLFAAGCLLTGAMAVEYNFDAFSNPSLLLQYDHNSQLVYWFLIFDMAGYYLLLLPAVLYLHQQFKYHSPWTSLFTFCGIGYVLTGAIGAAMLAATWPYLMQLHSVSPAANQQNIALVFNSINLLVTKGLWNMLEVLFAALWWIGFGKLLLRDYKIIGTLSLVAGFACLLDAVATIANWNMPAELGVNIYLLMGIVWPVALGVNILHISIARPVLNKTDSDFSNNEK